MVEDIYEIKNRIIERMEDDLQQGTERLDVKEFGMLADMVKDLAEAEKSCWEAEYYRSVTEAMGSGYSSGMGYEGMGYAQRGGQNGNQGGNRSGYRQSGRGSANQYGGSRRGYRMGHSDAMDMLRMEMQDPQRKPQILQELRRMTESA